jgi:hypothetical protein
MLNKENVIKTTTIYHLILDINLTPFPKEQKVFKQKCDTNAQKSTIHSSQKVKNNSNVHQQMNA